MADNVPDSPVLSEASAVQEVEPMVLDAEVEVEDAEPEDHPPVAVPKKQAKPRAQKAKKGDKVTSPVASTPTEPEGSKVVKPRVATASGIEWTSAVGTWDHEYEAKGRLIPLSKLCLDLKREHGQARRLSQDHISTIQATLKLRPPVGPASCLVWNDGSMFSSVSCNLLHLYIFTQMITSGYLEGST